MKNNINDKIEKLKQERATLIFLLDGMDELLNDPLTSSENFESIQVQWNKNKTRLQEIDSELQSLDIDEAVSTPDIATGLEKFKIDFPAGKKTAFIIMQFSETKLHKEITSCIKDTLEKHNVTALRADHKDYMDDLFPNVKVYMHGCDFGIAVFDRITEDDFNPNVSLEVGYMLGMGKNVLLLKDETLKSLQTDLAGKLYKQFNTQDIANTIPKQIIKWFLDKGLV